MVNENAIALTLTKSQYCGVRRLDDIFRYGVKQLIFESYNDFIDIETFDERLTQTKNFVLVEYRYCYNGVLFILLALVRRDGVLFLPDGSRADCEIDYIYVVD